MARKSIGFGAYDQFGWANEPQWGLFNPAQSLFAKEPTLYGSLFATNQNLDEAENVLKAKRRAKEHPGLPTQVGPRKGWTRNIGRKEVGSHNRLGEFGEGSQNKLLILGVILMIVVLFGIKKSS
tara:strand:+ start:159 stop:530 length:372 start_codon:yes stop_codon:yes gene_type:complete